MSLSGKVYAITGGARGIGLSTTKLLAERGATVCVADVNPDSLKEAETLLSAKGGKYSVTKVDVSRRAEVDAWIEGVVAQFGRLDGAANIAGVIGRHHAVHAVSELEDEDWDKIIAVNLTGCMYSMRAEIRHVQDGGSIVNMTSINGVTGKPPISPEDQVTSRPDPSALTPDPKGWPTTAPTPPASTAWWASPASRRRSSARERSASTPSRPAPPTRR